MEESKRIATTEVLKNSSIEIVTPRDSSEKLYLRRLSRKDIPVLAECAADFNQGNKLNQAANISDAHFSLFVKTALEHTNFEHYSFGLFTEDGVLATARISFDASEKFADHLNEDVKKSLTIPTTLLEVIGRGFLEKHTKDGKSIPNKGEILHFFMSWTKREYERNGFCSLLTKKTLDVARASGFRYAVAELAHIGTHRVFLDKFKFRPYRSILMKSEIPSLPIDPTEKFTFCYFSFVDEASTKSSE